MTIPHVSEEETAQRDGQDPIRPGAVPHAGLSRTQIVVCPDAKACRHCQLEQLTVDRKAPCRVSIQVSLAGADLGEHSVPCLCTG